MCIRDSCYLSWITIEFYLGMPRDCSRRYFVFSVETLLWFRKRWILKLHGIEATSPASIQPILIYYIGLLYIFFTFQLINSTPFLFSYPMTLPLPIRNRSHVAGQDDPPVCIEPVSYTHLDVYKRQLKTPSLILQLRKLIQQLLLHVSFTGDEVKPSG